MSRVQSTVAILIAVVAMAFALAYGLSQRFDRIDRRQHRIEHKLDQLFATSKKLCASGASSTALTIDRRGRTHWIKKPVLTGCRP